jgi:DNA-binding response OmpR family regulator
MAFSSAPHRRRRILVVDDELAARDAISRMLEARFEVMMAADGIEGVQVAALSPPDLIVTDVSMPRLDGFGMVQRIREQHRRKIPVIFLTALDSPRGVVAGIAAGARHYLTKPVDLNDLERRICRAFGVPTDV